MSLDKRTKPILWYLVMMDAIMSKPIQYIALCVRDLLGDEITWFCIMINYLNYLHIRYLFPDFSVKNLGVRVIYVNHIINFFQTNRLPVVRQYSGLGDQK